MSINYNYLIFSYLIKDLMSSKNILLTNENNIHASLSQPLRIIIVELIAIQTFLAFFPVFSCHLQLPFVEFPIR